MPSMNTDLQLMSKTSSQSSVDNKDSIIAGEFLDAVYLSRETRLCEEINTAVEIGDRMCCGQTSVGDDVGRPRPLLAHRDAQLPH